MTKARNWILSLNQFNQSGPPHLFSLKIHFSIILPLPCSFEVVQIFRMNFSFPHFTHISFKANSTLRFGLQTGVALSETGNACHIDHSIAVRIIQLIQNHNKLIYIYIYILCTVYYMGPKVLKTVSSVRPAGIRRHILVDRYKLSKGPASSICRVATTYKTNGATSHKTITVVLS
jgi:hypothetical protein